MTYQEAITSVKNGGTVKRTSWTGKSVKQVTDSNGHKEIQLTQTTTVKAPFLATQEDMYADDWATA